MTIQIPYKKFIAASLLLLYIFIATPVQCWHHHNNIPTAKTVTSKYQQNTFKNIGQSTELNCALCTHQYSVYGEACNVFILSAISLYSFNYSTFRVSLLQTAYLDFSNKGPPVVA